MDPNKIAKQYYCEKCNRTMAADQFYSSNNLEKYPNDGKFPVCKKCMTMRVDNWNPDTYLWILQEADVPYIPDEWNKLLASYGRNAKKMTGMTILGRYLSKMKLKQYGDYRWADTEHLQELAKNKIEQTMKQQGYSKADIDNALEKAIQPIPDKPVPIDASKCTYPSHNGSGNDQAKWPRAGNTCRCKCYNAKSITY